LELSELSFYPDAVGVMMRAGVLAGVHGAGLANQVFMRPRRGAVVEVSETAAAVCFMML
jgi:capsular polysaccharide biosynthesis protein